MKSEIGFKKNNFVLDFVYNLKFKINCGIIFDDV